VIAQLCLGKAFGGINKSSHSNSNIASALKNAEIKSNPDY
jgi:hypothetical protein